MAKVSYMSAGKDWRKAQSYLRAGTKFVVYCPEDRQCQVGLGLMLFGEPRGEKVRFSGKRRVVGLFAGALHFRVVDDKGPCKVGWAETDTLEVHFEAS
jgi:hypothetical protein